MQACNSPTFCSNVPQQFSKQSGLSTYPATRNRQAFPDAYRNVYSAVFNIRLASHTLNSSYLASCHPPVSRIGISAVECLLIYDIMAEALDSPRILAGIHHCRCVDTQERVIAGTDMVRNSRNAVFLSSAVNLNYR